MRTNFYILPQLWLLFPTYKLGAVGLITHQAFDCKCKLRDTIQAVGRH